MKDEPRLRTVDKARAPYALNRFPHDFIKRFSEEIICMMATKEPMSIEGNEWEQVFARCVGAKWTPSNNGLDDVQLGSSCWSAKTVMGNVKLANQKSVRLISGRNSPIYSFGATDVASDANPSEIGSMALEIWNERVSGIREKFKTARTVVLVKGRDYREYLIFETDTVRYEPDRFTFSWNKNGNLEGFRRDNEAHVFTWQPHGSQFTIIEPIPQDRLHLMVMPPKPISRDAILKAVGYEDSWVVEL